jgi:hypothetical protein
MLAHEGLSFKGSTGPKVMFSTSLFDLGVVEVSDSNLANRSLVDVWMRPIQWVLDRWYARCQRAQLSGTQSDTPTILFFPQFDGPMNRNGVVCRRLSGVPLTSIERFILKLSFRFEREPQ